MRVSSFAALVACALFAGGSTTVALAMSKKQAAPPPTASAPTAADSDSIWVGKSDEAKSCAKERGIELDSMAASLQSKNIKVLARKKVSDGKMRIQMCGVDKGDLNGFLISKKDLEQAKELGFTQLDMAGQHL